MTKADFKMSFSGDVPQSVQADIQSYVNSNTQLELGKSSRRDVRDPIGALNADQNAKDRAAAIPEGDVLVFVSGEVSGDSVDIGVKGESGVKGSAKVVKIGNFTANVTYECSNSVRQVAQKGAPLLWKGLEVAYDKTSRAFTFGNKAYNLKDYNFGPALRN